MRKQQIENAAFEVATQIRAVEDSIDATLLEIAELQSRMMRVNAVAHVGPAPVRGFSRGRMGVGNSKWLRRSLESFWRSSYSTR